MVEHGYGPRSVGRQLAVSVAAGAAAVSCVLTGCSSAHTSSHHTTDQASSTAVAGSTSSAVAGASSSTAPTATAVAGAAKVDPCTILTAADVHRVFGGTVSVKADAAHGVGRACDFNVAASALGNYASVDVLTDVALPPEGDPVTGVGDHAIYDPLEGIPFITFTKGAASVQITYGSDTQVAASKQQFTIKFPATIKASTIALATTVAGRI